MGESSIKNLTLTSAPVGDNAVIFYLPEPVQANYPLLLQSLSARAQAENVIDCVVAYHSLLVIFDAEQNCASDVSRILQDYLPEAIRLSESTTEQRLIRIPVCYEPPYALDIERVAERAKLSIDELITCHKDKVYTVCCKGFSPGFAFLGYVDDGIATPRHAEPRAKIPAGSVGIAGTQTGVYPVESPGGWQIIGRTPMTLYAPEQNLFSHFEIGDQVAFYPISADEFSAWSDDND